MLTRAIDTGSDLDALCEALGTARPDGLPAGTDGSPRLQAKSFPQSFWYVLKQSTFGLARASLQF